MTEIKDSPAIKIKHRKEKCFPVIMNYLKIRKKYAHTLNVKLFFLCTFTKISRGMYISINRD